MASHLRPFVSRKRLRAWADDLEREGETVLAEAVRRAADGAGPGPNVDDRARVPAARDRR